MPRKLARIEKISEVSPIKDADKIEKVKIKGWPLVVKKGEFQPEDFCVYFEIDSLLPATPTFEFMKAFYKPKVNGYRLKTVKMRGQISQGLALPTSILPEGVKIEEGKDVTELLNIRKYEIEIEEYMKDQIKGAKPAFIETTDEERIQNLPDYLEEYKGRHFYFSEKLDGDSTTYYWNEDYFGCCKRNIEFLDSCYQPEWEMAKKLELKEKLMSYDKNIALQGEFVGPGVQSNRLGLEEKEFRVFNVFDIDNYRRFNYSEFKKFTDNLEIAIVPIIDEDFILDIDMESLILMADGKSLMNEKKRREGIVFRLLEDSSISFKVISNKYILKHDV